MIRRPNSALTLALLLALGTGYYYFHLLLPRARSANAAIGMAGGYAYGGDFYPIWLTGREMLLHGKDPYTEQMTRQIQTGLFGRPIDPERASDPPRNFRAFTYPVYVDLLVVPLEFLGFNAVRLVLGILLPLITAASVVFWLRSFHVRMRRSVLAVAIILTLVSYPVLEGLYALQAALLVGAALALATAALDQGRLILAGVLIAFASVKPQLVWLLAVWLLLWAVSDWKRRNKFALSFIFTMALLFLASQLFLPGWFAEWWRAISAYPSYTLPPLTQLVLGRFLGDALGLVTLALAGTICWSARRQEPGSAGFSLAVSFVLAVTILVAPTGGAVYDQVILLPAIFWLGARRGEILKASARIRAQALLALAALGWQWFAACGVALGSMFSPAWARRADVLVFPTRMAASFPFVVLALLAFFVVRVVREGALPTRARG